MEINCLVAVRVSGKYATVCASVYQTPVAILYEHLTLARLAAVHAVTKQLGIQRQVFVSAAAIKFYPVKLHLPDGGHITLVVHERAWVVFLPDTTAPIQIPFHSQVEGVTPGDKAAHIREAGGVDGWVAVLVVLTHTALRPTLVDAEGRISQVSQGGKPSVARDGAVPDHERVHDLGEQRLIDVLVEGIPCAPSKWLLPCMTGQTTKRTVIQ